MFININVEPEIMYLAYYLNISGHFRYSGSEMAAILDCMGM